MRKETKNLGGYIGLIAIIIVTLVIATWFAYLWQKQWFKGFNIGIGENKTEENKPVTEQLNDLRVDLKQIQDKKDKEIYDAMEEEGKKANDMLKQ